MLDMKFRVKREIKTMRKIKTVVILGKNTNYFLVVFMSNEISLVNIHSQELLLDFSFPLLINPHANSFEINDTQYLILLICGMSVRVLSLNTEE